MIALVGEKQLVWMGTSKKDLMALPAEVQNAFGYALHLVQHGRKSSNAKVLKGFHGGRVMEVVKDHRKDTYRAVYAVESERVYVLHCFQKKSKRGVATPKPDMDLVKTRMEEADRLHRKWLATRNEDLNEEVNERGKP